MPTTSPDAITWDEDLMKFFSLPFRLIHIKFSGALIRRNGAQFRITLQFGLNAWISNQPVIP